MVHILKALMSKTNNKFTNKAEYVYPTITIAVFDKNNRKNHRANSHYDERTSSNLKNPRLPFSAKRVCRQRDPVHNINDDAVYDDVILPGDKKEIDEFCKEAINSSRVQLNISIPLIDIIFESKQLYEIIYNRLNSDLFMWEASSPLLRNDEPPHSYTYRGLMSDNLMDSIYDFATSSRDTYCGTTSQNSKSELLDSISREMEEESNMMKNNYMMHESTSESIYYSTNENNLNKCTNTLKPLTSLNAFAINLSVDRGSLTLYSPVRDGDNHVLPGQLGQFDFRISGFRFFAVTEYNKNENLNYICIQSNDIQMFHCGLIPLNIPITLNKCGADVKEHMESTFYNIPQDSTNEISTNASTEPKEVLAIVIEVKKVPQEKLKRLKITTSVNNGILRYNPSKSLYSWFNQIIDFLDVVDYPIEGFAPFALVTEIQIHFSDCAIDYRPKNFCHRAMVDVGSLTLSSNIVSSVTSCNLRFVAEECILSIAPFENSQKTLPNHKITILDSSNLINVLDLGLFDISLRLNQQNPGDGPNLDLRCSVHDVHLRTCSDSGLAVAQLIAYIANDGDINASEKDETNFAFSSASSSTLDPTELGNIKTAPESSQQERVNKLMAEAVQDVVSETSLESPEIGQQPHGFEIFYFPDENSKISNLNSTTESTHNKNKISSSTSPKSNIKKNSNFEETGESSLPQVKSDLGLVRTESNKSSPEKDYCIIPDDDKSFMNQCGIKNIKISEDPLRIVDNHFYLPVEKPDLLRPPTNFPNADFRYTLCEMTFTWHLYGGNDFPDISDTLTNDKKKNNKPKMSETYKHGVSYYRSTVEKINLKNAKQKMAWKTKGGSGRILDVLVEFQFSKIRFSHEVYPVNTYYASRQVLLITDIEIRDRLRSSEINKFLYHPNTRNLPNKSVEHMVVIKAYHIRPNPQSLAQECSLRISILPIKLNIDQNTLLFLEGFFSNFVGQNENETNEQISNEKKSDADYLHNTPVMSVEEETEAMQSLKARRLVSKNLDILIDEGGRAYNSVDTETTTAELAQPIYFREVIFSPALPICLDYHGHRVELSRGPVAGLLMGLAQLQGSGICLRQVINRRGILGWDKLFMYLVKEWLRDIKRNQLPKILSGIGPTNAVLQLFQGIYDLFWLPIEQYQKDGRIIRGFQMGAQSFSARTALAALEITSRIIYLLQFTAETTFDMLSPGPSVRRARMTRKGKRRVNRPKDIREGVTNAYMIVKEGINDSANSLIETAVIEHDQKGYTGAIGAVMRQIPQLVVCPAVLATQATTNILGGAKSSLVPEAKLEARQKWKDDNN